MEDTHRIIFRNIFSVECEECKNKVKELKDE